MNMQMQKIIFNHFSFINSLWYVCLCLFQEKPGSIADHSRCLSVQVLLRALDVYEEPLLLALDQLRAGSALLELSVPMMKPQSAHLAGQKQQDPANQSQPENAFHAIACVLFLILWGQKTNTGANTGIALYPQSLCVLSQILTSGRSFRATMKTLYHALFSHILGAAVAAPALSWSVSLQTDIIAICHEWEPAVHPLNQDRNYHGQPNDDGDVFGSVLSQDQAPCTYSTACDSSSVFCC